MTVDVAIRRKANTPLMWQALLRRVAPVGSVVRVLTHTFDPVRQVDEYVFDVEGCSAEEFEAHHE